MARRLAAASRDRGGEGIPSLRASRTRLITALGSVGLLAAASVYTGSGSGRFAGLGEYVGLVGAPLLAVAIVIRYAPLVPWAIAVTGCGYVVGRAGHESVDGWAAVVGGGLLLAAELAGWAIEHDARIAEGRALVVRRIALVGGLVAVSVLVGFLLLGAAALASSSTGILLSAIGMAAAISSVVVILRLLRG